MNITRRTFNAALAFTGAAAAIGLSPWKLISEAAAQTAEQIAKPSTLGDMGLGPKDAKVTIIEYASMTCPHCAAFTKDVFPKLKEAYIDTGKIHFIFREFPLDQVALAASALSRCVAKGDSGKYFAMIDTLFRQQADLQTKPLDTINRVGRMAGFSEQAIKDCVQTDLTVQKGILDDRKYANDVLKIDSTPSFFVNGKLVKGETSFEAFQQLIDPVLKG